MTRSTRDAGSFPRHTASPDDGRTPRLTVVCFPYAGGGAGIFRPWRRHLPDDIALVPLHLPGRETRIAEPAAFDAREIADELAAHVAPPFVCYGHSMGARLAFDVVRHLYRDGAPLPEALYVGAAGAPHRPEPLGRLAALSDDDLLDEIVALGGAPPELLASAELRDLALPPLRSDIRWVEDYRYEPGPTLPVPITAFAGATDADVGPTGMMRWAAHTRAGFRLHTLDGGHFFLDAAGLRLAALVAADEASDALPLPEPDEVHVWLADLELVAALSESWDELSPGEALRAARFRSDTDRARYIGQCVVLRRVLGRYGVYVGTAELRAAANGKPHVDHPSGVRFNASRSGRYVLVGITAGAEVGVDVEQLRPMADLDAFCDGAMDAVERAELAALRAADRLHAALATWTAKEAVLKATGDGLSVEPTLFGFARRPAGTPWRAHAAAGLERLTRWDVTHLMLDDVVAAVALPIGDWRLRVEVPTIARL